MYSRHGQNAAPPHIIRAPFPPPRSQFTKGIGALGRRQEAEGQSWGDPARPGPVEGCWQGQDAGREERASGAGLARPGVVDSTKPVMQAPDSSFGEAGATGSTLKLSCRGRTGKNLCTSQTC